MFIYFTSRDQKTIDLENRANYNALRQRWRILDKTIQVPSHEMSIHDNPTYMELSDDDSADPIYPAAHREVSKPEREEKDIINSLEDTGDLCSRCNKVIRSEVVRSQRSSLTSSDCTSSGENGFLTTESSDTSSSVRDQTTPPNTGSDGGTSGQTSASVSRAEGGTECDICEWRSSTSCQCRCHSNSLDNLASDELALLQILDFPSRVSYSYSLHIYPKPI